MSRFPSLFVSHGAPTLVLEKGGAADFLRGYGVLLGKPEAILVVSAHWETDTPAVGTTPAPETIYDFRGFPAELYQMRYAAPGAPDLAERAAGLVEAGMGGTVRRDPRRGLDHGAWVPLSLMYPDADIPVTQLSILHQGGPAAHLALGEAIRPLRDEGVLVLASGSATHNLYEFRGFDYDSAPPDWVVRASAIGWPAPSPGAARRTCWTIGGLHPRPNATIRPRSICCRCSPPWAPRHRDRSAPASTAATPMACSPWTSTPSIKLRRRNRPSRPPANNRRRRPSACRCVADRTGSVPLRGASALSG